MINGVRHRRDGLGALIHGCAFVTGWVRLCEASMYVSGLVNPGGVIFAIERGRSEVAVLIARCPCRLCV